MSKTPQRNRRGEKGEEKKKGGREARGRRKKEEGGGGSDGKRSQKTHFTKYDPDDGFCFSIMAVH